MEWWVARVLLGVLCCGAVAECTDCPAACRCFLNLDSDSQQTITVDCRGQDLVSIPSPLPNATSHLDLSNNLIHSIQPGDFWPGATGIRHLQLQNNDISSVAADAFTSLQELEILILYNNYQLEELENGTFDSLGNLQRLVAYNTGVKKLSPALIEPLVNIVELDFSFSQLECISMGTFQNLSRLKTLTLSSNLISTVETGSFVNLPALQYLSLNHNQIRAVPTMTFQGLDNIRTITLSGNPLDCTCSALYLYQFLLGEGLSGPSCEEPAELNGRDLLSLQEDEFCALPVANLTAPALLIVPNFSPLELSCVTSGTPPPQVTWSRDGMVLEADGSLVVIMGGSLLISNASQPDSGQYHCSASSSAGLVSSSVQVLVLSEEESLTDALVGQDVVLECSSQVPSGTEVLWSFNASTLAPVSSKYVVLRDGSLLIQEVGLEDMGQYSCQLGQVQLLRTLSLTASPQITFITQGGCENPLMVRVDSDMILLLRCVATAVPPPTVQWLLGNTILNSSLPSNNSQVEVTFELFRPRVTDEGNYTCVASNDMGADMATLFVDVRMIGPLVQVGVSQLEHFAGDTVAFECPLRGLELEPGYQVMWDRMSAMLPLDRINFTCNNESLILRDARAPQDIDSYMCRVQEPSGRIFTFTILLTIFEPPVIEAMCSPVSVVIGIEGEDVEFSCLTSERPTGIRVWSVDGVPLSAGGRVSFLDGTRRVLISAVEETDTGVYNCTVSNVINDVECSDSLATQLVVHRTPQLLTTPSNTSVVSGGTVQLPCSGDGRPAPSLTWWRLVEGVASQVLTDGQYYVTFSSLLLRDASGLNEGVYYCNLTSVAGTVLSESVFLDVLEPPRFLSFRPASTFKAGERGVRLECSGTGDPQPSVEWLRLPGGIIIPSPAFPNYVRNGSDLVILEVMPEDAGLYRCSLSNAAGQTAQDITVTVKAPPSPSVEPGEVLANVGCQVTLTCLDAGSPPLDFQWSFNDMPLPLPVETGPQALVRVSGQLLLSNLRLQDSGNYSCTVSGSEGDVTASAVLTVNDPLSGSGVFAAPPTITSPTPSTLLLSMGQAAQFLCLVEGFPLPEVVWRRDGEELANLRRYTVAGEVLTVRDVRVTDEGLYQCTASNQLGQDVREFSLNITAPPSIITHPLPQQVPEGGGATLICSATGDPAPSITWQLDGVELVNDARHHISTVPATVSFLILSNASISEDTGTYSCLAENVAGIAQHSVVITVVPAFFAPELVTPPASRLLGGGDTVALTCEVAASPPANVTWLVGAEPAPPCSRDLLNMSVPCVMLEMLVIQSFDPEHQGQYSCVAANELGVAVTEVTLRLAPEQITLPSIEQPPLPQWVLNGSSFLLDCLASGAPPPQLQWLLNMAPVNLSEDIFQQLENGSLLVLEAGEESVGFFTCVADNGLGRSKVTVLVDTVEFLASSTATMGLSSPMLTSYPLGSLTLFPGQSATLDCTASGQPPPTITWTRNGLPLTSLTTPTLSLAGNGSLVLLGVTGAEQGNYSCMASNEAGVSISPFQLLIEDGLISGTGEDTAQGDVLETLSGSYVQLNCSSAGGVAGGVAVLWLHEGEVVQEDRLVKVNGDGSLQISAAHTAHAGHYMCLSPSNRGWTTSSVQLQVTPREEPPSFSVEPEDVHVVKKGFAVLPCSAHSSTGELTHVHWTWAGSNISRTGQRHAVLQDNSLVLTNVRLQDAGEYSCVASNSYGRSLSTAMMTVSRWKVEEFLFREEGSTVRLTCGLGTGEGVGWLKDGHTPLPTFNGEVWLHDVDHTHQGEYTCSYEKDRLSYFLYVHAAPEMTTPPHIVAVSLGGTATLNCVATGRPRPQISWHHGGLLLGTDEHLSVLTNGSLVLYEVKAERDAGTYTCRAHNSVGEAETRILLFLT